LKGCGFAITLQSAIRIFCYPSPVQYIASLTPAAAPDPISAIADPPERATVVELRTDLFDECDISAAVANCPLPVLVTLRSQAEGGQGPVDPKQRSAALRGAREAGAALIDLEYERDLALVDELGLAPEQYVLSWHHPTETPANLSDTAGAMLDAPGQLIKIIPTANRLGDLERLLALYQGFGRERKRLLAFAMGTLGLASRYLAPLLGAPVSFAAWRESAPAAPGQLSAGRLDGAIGHLEGPPQRLYGVVGADVSGSLSPVLHAAAFRHEQLPYLLVPISVGDENELTELFVTQGSTLFDRVGLPAFGWAVTSPYKRQAAAAATMPAPRVSRAGAANTLVLKARQVIADNTDADGVVGSLVGRGVDASGLTALIQGTGGAARGAAIGLDLAGATVVLRGRDPGQTQAVAEEIGVDGWIPGRGPLAADLLVNATPLGGSDDDPIPFSTEEISGASVVLDMVYRDHPTALAEAAGSAGVEMIDGREMLLYQGYAQFAAFTGRLPPKDAMRAALKEA
jgi:3-dehydroquinate dehydratase/shikimate dehydrogenase